LEGWDQAAAGRCPVAGYAPTGSSFRVTTHLPRNDAPVARRLLSPVTDEDEIRGRELYLGYARDGRSALWLRLPNEEDVSKALRVLADYDYLHARYYGFNTGLCRLMSVIDSTNSGGGRSSANRGSGWGTSVPCGASPKASQSRKAEDEVAGLVHGRRHVPSSASSDGRVRHPVRFGQADDWAAPIKRRSAPDCPGPYATTP
jgi:hypothetical protein